MCRLRLVLQVARLSRSWPEEGPLSTRLPANESQSTSVTKAQAIPDLSLANQTGSQSCLDLNGVLDSNDLLTVWAEEATAFAPLALVARRQCFLIFFTLFVIIKWL